MAESDPLLNVFSGERALHDFYDPDKCPPIPLVELPARLNPYRGDGVRIYAKLMSHVPATNIKSLPGEKGAITEDTHTLVEYSSGSTVISLGILANIYGIPHTKAYLSNKTSPTKLDLLRFFGLDLTLFAGHGQPEPQDPNGGIFTATQHGQQEGRYNPDQYSNPENYESHMRWTGPQIMKQLPGISVFAASIGTSGTMTGTGLYLKDVKPSIARVGVCTTPGDRVPGPRMFSLLAPVTFPWRSSVDTIEEVGPYASYAQSLALCRAGLLVGPSSGLALQGLFNFLEKKKKAGELDKLRDAKGEILCVFICCDQPFQYISEYFQKLGPEHFLPIRNAELIGVDPYDYNIDWEITPHTAHALLAGSEPPQVQSTPLPTPENRNTALPALPPLDAERPLPPLEGSERTVIVLDLRAPADFSAAHIRGARSLPVCVRGGANPYKDAGAMGRVFAVLEARLGGKDKEPLVDLLPALAGRTVLTLSYRGHTARLAMSVLRARGVRAHCVMGGREAWVRAPVGEVGEQITEDGGEGEQGGLWEASCAL
ncbi:cysteine synthase [Mycena sp. CBHHK59/15]|nr:cysteine synthase [Mycena sp. CBHHK59/15]